jgi:putative oxidoreductase
MPRLCGSYRLGSRRPPKYISSDGSPDVFPMSGTDSYTALLVLSVWGDKMIDQRTAPYGILLLRVTLGCLFIAHLYWKFAILDGGLDKWWANLINNGYPAVVPWYAISAEFAGALLLIPGIYARWVALYTLPLMVGAAQYWAVRKGFYFTAGGFELPAAWTIMLILQILLGDGPYATISSSIRQQRPLAPENS